MTGVLSPDAAELLREIAWDAVRSRVADRPFGVELPGTGPLAAPGSAFVTLTRRGRLRGCVGMIGDRMSLGEAVRQAAVSVTRDPRFPPLAGDEMKGLELSISVLGPFTAVASVDEVRSGEHGVHVTDGSRSALFLPQVAAERGWDRDRLLTEVCRKAGLPGDRWREPGLTVEVFTAAVY